MVHAGLRYFNWPAASRSTSSRKQSDGAKFIRFADLELVRKQRDVAGNQNTQDARPRDAVARPRRTTGRTPL